MRWAVYVGKPTEMHKSFRTANKDYQRQLLRNNYGCIVGYDPDDYASIHPDDRYLYSTRAEARKQAKIESLGNSYWHFHAAKFEGWRKKKYKGE